MEHHSRFFFRTFKIKKELGEIFLNQFVLTFAIALIGVFVPLYLLSLGLQLQEVFIFFIIYELSWVFFSFASPRITARLGIRHALAMSVGLIVIFFSCLLYAAYIHPVFLYAIAVIGGIAHNLYWTPLNTEFVKYSDKINESREIGELFAVPHIAVMIAPFIGGLVLSIAGFNPLFSVAIVLMLVSLIPFFYLKEYRIPRYRQQHKWRLRREKRVVLGMVVNGMFMVAASLTWPLYIFFNLSDVLPVGIAATVHGIALILFTTLVGWLGDRTDRNRLFKLGALIYAGVWFLRGFAHTPLEIYLMSFIAAVGWSFVAVPLFARFSDIARKENILQDSALRESLLHTGKVIPIIILLLLPLTFTHVFILTGFVALAMCCIGIGK